MSIAYITDNNGANKVSFDIDPTPVPLVVYETAGSKRRTLNSMSGGVITPGVHHHYIGGGHITGAVIDVNIIKMTRSTYESIVTQMLGCQTILFTPDDGATLYECVFAPGSQSVEQIDGTELLRMTLKLEILSVTINEE